MKNIALLQNNGVNVEDGVRLLGSIDLYDEALQQFSNDITGRLNRIKSYKEQNDMQNYYAEIEKLKHDSKCLGFTKLIELAEQHELAIKQQNNNFVMFHYNELTLEALRIITLVNQYNGQFDMTGNITTDDSKKAIIVADDSNIIRSFVSKILSDQFDILQAIDGNEVINIIEQNSDKEIVGMLLDLNMPNVNGFAVLDYFKQNSLFNDIPVSLITGDDTKDSIDKAFQYPIIDMLNKPFNENDLRRIVERTISLHKSL